MPLLAWTQAPGDKYVVTGVDFHGRRFKPITVDSYYVATCYNIYKGSIWLLRDGKRKLIQRVWN